MAYTIDLKGFSMKLIDQIISFFLRYSLERIGTFGSKNGKQPSKNFQNQLERSE